MKPDAPRHVGAKIGIVVAAITVALLLYRLAMGTAPVATRIFMSSESALLLSVDGLEVDGENVLPTGWTPPGPGQRGVEAKPAPQAVVPLRVGRPASIKVTFAVPRSATASCTLDPRPYGECAVRLRFVSPADLRCEFECEAAAITR